MKIIKTDAEWRALLSPEAYEITRRKGTERAFTGRYWQTHEPGLYHCVCCGAELFDAGAKFDSGTGWPSFFAPFAEDRIVTEDDHSQFMVRTEIQCARCGAHLGHLFDDGPRPTGLRYCVNSAALELRPRR